MTLQKAWIGTVLLLMVLSAVVPVRLFGTVQFEAQVNPDAVYAGETFELSFSLTGADWGEIDLPDLSAFERVSGPAMAIRTTIINGRMERVATHTYRLRAMDEGTFTIPEARMFADGKIFTSSAVQVMVLHREEHAPTDPPFLAKVSLSCDTCYVGQQIALDLVLYSRVPIADYAVMEEAELTGFHSRRYRNLRNIRSGRDTLDGRLYNTRVLARYILFPQHRGKFGGEHFELRVVEEDRDPRWRGMFRLRGEVHYTRVKIPEFTVLSAPPNAPEGFDGHIGDFEISTVYREHQLKQGELWPVSVIVRGDGDPASMRPPAFALSEGLVLADIRLQRDDVTERGGGLRTTREWQALFRTDSAGLATIDPYLITYQVDLDTFKKIRGERINAFVDPGDPLAEREGEAVAPTVDEDLSRHRDGIPIWVVYTGLPVLLFIGFVFYLFFKNKVTGDTAPEGKEALLKKLKQAATLSGESEKSQCAKVLDALDQYILHLIKVPMSEWEEDLLRRHLVEELGADRSEKLLVARKRLTAVVFGNRSEKRKDISRLINDLLSDLG
ncbi:MAG: hypothetical protein EA411_02105 [Saprospirales bacterium]|nr:MAG: hypothetical protein EA411_02105 [Saprospirales bacterium]